MAALERIASHARAITATHVTFKFMDRCRLWSADDIEGNGLVGVASDATDFQKAIAGVERVAERRRWLRRSLEAEHAFIPCFDRQPIGLLARFAGPLGGGADRGAVDVLPGLRGHVIRMASTSRLRQATTACRWRAKAALKRPAGG